MNYKKLIFSLIFVSHTVCASNAIFTMSGGPAWYSAGQTQTFALQPGYNNTYVASKFNQVLAKGEWFLGVSHSLAQLGIAVATTSNASLQGQVWELGDPLFNNFTYNYNLQHTHFALKGKLLTDLMSNTFLPYISASAGVGFNLANQFMIKSLLFESINPAPFSAHTTTAFTYTLGAGMQYAINHQWSFGIGYDFSDWGASGLGRAYGQTLNTGLTLNHLYTNQLQFNLSCLA